MDQRRKKRIEEAILRELGLILLKNSQKVIFDKVTIVAVEISPDLAVARVFFSLFDGLDIKNTTEALQREAKFLRKLLAHTLNLRSTPRLIFVYDDSLARGRKIIDLIDKALGDSN